MQETLSQWLNQVPDSRTEKALRPLLTAILAAFGSAVITATTIAIATTTTAVRSSTTTCRYTVNGRTVLKAATDNLWTLAGTVVNGTFNVFVLYLDAAGNAAARMGQAGATLAAVKYPETPEGFCAVGMVTINPTGTGNFVGGTTPLGDVTVAPGAIYVPITGPFIPNANAL
jgi:hypothetical protein